MGLELQKGDPVRFITSQELASFRNEHGRDVVFSWIQDMNPLFGREAIVSDIKPTLGGRRRVFLVDHNGNELGEDYSISEEMLVILRYAGGKCRCEICRSVDM